MIDLKEILYCEASSNYTNFFFTSGSSICTAKSIHEYEDILADFSFMRIHKSFLVNLVHVKGYLRGEGGKIIMSNKQELGVSRRKKEEFLKKMKAIYKMYKLDKKVCLDAWLFMQVIGGKILDKFDLWANVFCKHYLFF